MRIPSHLLVAASSWISRIVTVLIQLTSVRIILASLGSEAYAVFALLTGLVGWYLLADFGLGASLQNHISESRAKKTPYQGYIAGAGLLAILGLIISTGLLYLASPYLGPTFLKSFGFLSQHEKVTYFFVTGVFFIGASIGGIAYKVWYAQQRGYLSNILPAFGYLIGLGGIWFVTGSHLENKLFWSLFFFVSVPAVLAMAAFAAQFYKSVKRADDRKLDRDILKNLLKRAFNFWFFGLMAAGVLQIDYIVMSQFLAAQDIVIYNITTKVFNLIFFIYSAVLLALWPVCAEAISRNEWGDVMRYIKKYLWAGMVFLALSTLLLFIFMPGIVAVLSPKEEFRVPWPFLSLVGFYFVIRVWTDTFAMVLQSMSDLRPFWVFVPIQTLISVSLQWALVPCFGINGVMYGLIGSFILTVAWALPLAVLRNFTGARRITV